VNKLSVRVPSYCHTLLDEMVVILLRNWSDWWSELARARRGSDSGAGEKRLGRKLSQIDFTLCSYFNTNTCHV